ncbi:MAG TPA: TldD/PmbA family protein [Chloroflexota bacterium]|nr:TldD/PmbA family protein [Chloroflexota bacterium]
MAPELDPSFLSLPFRGLADAALARAQSLGVEHADFRFERNRSGLRTTRDGVLERSIDDEDLGFAVRVIQNGTWGFAADVDLTPEAAVGAVDRAAEVARISQPLSVERVELADEPIYPDVTWVSSYEINPFDVPETERLAVLEDWSRRLLAAPGISHVDTTLWMVQENKFYADLAGTRTTQQRVRIHPEIEALSIDPSGAFETMRSLQPPSGRGWEYVKDRSWDETVVGLPELLAEKMRAPSVEPGQYDLVVDPSNLWLTIHESIGHATELDRVLGYEAAFAGTSFATLDKLGTLQYGSSVMTVTGDRTVEHGLATVGYDDDGVAAQSFDLIKDGVLVGYQLDRRMARQQGFGRSNGCAFADSPAHIPVQRMANVSLQPAPNGPSTDDLIGRVERGIYIVGDKSWSIDMQRYNFQFTGQRFYKIENGRLAGQLNDVAYQATTTDFWGAMEAVGGPQTYVLGGSFMCGKAQPAQIAAVGHGAPSALFRGIRILNTRQEAGR